ncbi:YoaK family protein [Silvimonas sp. JCM 19000]
MTLPDREITLGVSYGFVAGYVDTLGFIALSGLFTAHVTGNFVLIGATLAHFGHGVLLKLVAFAAFVLMVALTRLLLLAVPAAHALTFTRVLQVVLLAAFMGLGIAARGMELDAPLSLACGALGAAAMAVQNAVSRILLPSVAPTTVMTGNVTQLVIDVVDVVRCAASPEVRKRIKHFFWPVVAFAAGAISGAYAWMGFGFIGLLLPMALLLGLVGLDRADVVGAKA